MFEEQKNTLNSQMGTLKILLDGKFSKMVSVIPNWASFSSYKSL